MTVKVTPDGVEIPASVIEAEKIVIRTPTQTVDMSSGFQTMVRDGKFPLITPDFFDGDDGDVTNPTLQPNKISFKEYGEEVEEYEVEIISE